MAFKIPAPFEGEEEDFEYVPIVRVGTQVPFGYMVSPDDEDVLLPVPEELDLLNQAKKYLRRYSYRDVAAWLSDHSGRPITYNGLRHRIQIEQKRNREQANLRHLIRRLEKAIEKEKRLEETKFGRVRIKGSSESEA